MVPSPLKADKRARIRRLYPLSTSRRSEAIYTAQSGRLDRVRVGYALAAAGCGEAARGQRITPI